MMPPRGRAGRLVFPALRWSQANGFEHEQERIDRALELGAGGFVIFGGEASAVRELTASLRARAGRPLLFASDLERGAGQQFHGATALPPAAAIASLDDLETTRRAGEVTGREALALGVNWVYAPVADVDLEPRNPIVGTRAFGSRAETVAHQVAAWVAGCVSTGALCCPKHFPGHGRTTVDSHAALPTVAASRDDMGLDLRPFYAAFAAGATTTMTAHVAYTALDPDGAPATRSRPIIAGLLRREIGFGGLVVTDALIMAGILEGADGEGAAAVAAIAAGCDALLYPDDVAAVAGALETAPEDALPNARLGDAIERVDAFAARTPAGGTGEWSEAEDRRWALEIATSAIQPVRGVFPSGPEFELVTVDDDEGGPYRPPSRETFPVALAEHGVVATEVAEATGGHPILLAVYADIRGWKARAGLSAAALNACRTVASRGQVTCLLFGHPRQAAELPGESVLVAWGGEPIMQRAAAVRIARSVHERAAE